MEPQRQAITVPFSNLRSALDNKNYAGAVGAAKDLAKAACKLTIEKGGGNVPRGAGLPAIFKEALHVSGMDNAGGDVGRSLAATIHRLAELRNTVGSGHGRALQPAVGAREARLAASAACAVALFVLTDGS